MATHRHRLNLRSSQGKRRGRLRACHSATPRLKLPLICMRSIASALVSEDEFLALPESNQPQELVDGEVIVAPSPSFLHQRLSKRLLVALETWAATREGDVTIAQAPLDVRFGPGRILQPDLMIFRGSIPDDVETPIDRIPALCIEVLSNNRAYDRVTKRYIYAEAGVAEYWVVDPCGVVERRTGPMLASLETVADLLTSELLPEFSLDLSTLF